MCPAEIESNDNAYAVRVALFNYTAQHRRIHIGICMMVLQFGWIERHNTSRVDDKGICGKILQILDQGVGIEAALVRGKIGLNNAKVIRLPPRNRIGPCSRQGFPIRFFVGTCYQQN